MIVILSYNNDEYEGVTGTGDYVGRAKSVSDLPDLPIEEDYVYFAHQMRKGGAVYSLEMRYLSKYTAFGRYGEEVYGWWDGNVLVKELSRKWWGQQAAELPPGYSRVWQDDNGVLHLISDVEYERLQAEWRARNPQPQGALNGTMVAWWGNEGLDQYILNRMKSAHITSTFGSEE